MDYTEDIIAISVLVLVLTYIPHYVQSINHWTDDNSMKSAGKLTYSRLLGLKMEIVMA